MDELNEFLFKLELCDSYSPDGKDDPIYKFLSKVVVEGDIVSTAKFNLILRDKRIKLNKEVLLNNLHNAEIKEYYHRFWRYYGSHGFMCIEPPDFNVATDMPNYNRMLEYDDYNERYNENLQNFMKSYVPFDIMDLNDIVYDYCADD
jgi:hypothetical protein